MIETDPETGYAANDFEDTETPGAAPSGAGSPAPAPLDGHDAALMTALAQAPDPNEIQMTGDPAIDNPGGSPAQAAAPQSLVPGQSVGGSVGQSTSSRGMTPQGIKLASGVFGKEEAKANARNTESDAQLAAHNARLAEDFKASSAAMGEMTKLHIDHLAEMSKIHQDEYDAAVLQGQLEQHAQAQAHAEGAQYIANYKNEMVGVRQLMMQSGNPLGGLDTTGGLALAAAEFTQGFLGARGINVNVSGQVDRWVEREMAHHQQTIQNMTNAAQSNLTLYGLARQGAQDDWEARQRLRGFVIDGMKARTMMEADRYGSANATAEAKQKAAMLDVEQANNDMLLQMKVTKEKQDSLQLGIDSAAKQSAAATASYSASTEASYKAGMLKLAQDKADKESAPTPPHLIADETSTRIDQNGNPVLDENGKPVEGGKYTWQLDESLGREVLGPTIKNVSANKLAYGELATNLDRLRELHDKAAPFMKGPEIARKLHPEYRQYVAEKGNIVSNMVRAYSGLAASDSERKTFQDRLESNQWLQEGDNKALISELSQDMRIHYQKAMNSMLGIGLLKAPDNAGYETAPVVDQGGAARDSIALQREGAVTTPIGAAANEVRGGVGKFGPDTNANTDFFDIPTLKTPTKAWTALMPEGTAQPEVSRRIEDLAKGYINPSEYRAKFAGDKTLPKDNRYLRGQILDALKALSENKDIGANVQGYAGMIINSLNEGSTDPAKAAEVQDMFKD